MSRKRTAVIVAIFVLLFPSVIIYAGGDEIVPPSIQTATTDANADPFEPAYWPTRRWRSANPAAMGLDPAVIADISDYNSTSSFNSQAFVLIKDGYIVAEEYWFGYNRWRQHESFSVSKSFISALIGIAIEDGYIESLDDPIHLYLPDYADIFAAYPDKQAITIRDLLMMSSGLRWRESGDGKLDFIEPVLMSLSSDFGRYTLRRPLINEPGTVFNYSTGDATLLSIIIHEATGMRTDDYAKEVLMGPIGAPDVFWADDPSGHVIGGFGLRATAREYAKFGYLFMMDGQWDGEQIVDADWVELTTQANPLNNEYGYQWWTGASAFSDSAARYPEGTFMASGAFNQTIIVIPEYNVVAVRLSLDNETTQSAWSEAELITMIGAAIAE